MIVSYTKVGALALGWSARRRADAKYFDGSGTFAGPAPTASRALTQQAGIYASVWEEDFATDGTQWLDGAFDVWIHDQANGDLAIDSGIVVIKGNSDAPWFGSNGITVSFPSGTAQAGGTPTSVTVAGVAVTGSWAGQKILRPATGEVRVIKTHAVLGGGSHRFDLDPAGAGEAGPFTLAPVASETIVVLG